MDYKKIMDKVTNSRLESEKLNIMKEIIEILNKASEAYYGGKEELISNYEWDQLFDTLSELEKETNTVFKNSPTKSLVENMRGKKEKHEFPALSLDKTKDIDVVKKWMNNKPVWISWKLDGLTLVLTYDNGILTKILTRGNGEIGTDITRLKNSIRGIPLTIDYKGHLVLRGEGLISYTDFDNINLEIEDEDKKYQNPRNLASGTLNLDDPKVVKNRNVNFIAFNLVSVEKEINSWDERMKFLNTLGFNVVEYIYADKDNISDVIDSFTLNLEEGKMDYPVDGLVVCYEDYLYASNGPVTSHHAEREGLAFKWEDIAVETKLIEIEWSPAFSLLSPVAIFETVNIEGTDVSRASLHNISEMERLGIGEGCTLQIIKANKIIPKCIGTLNSSKVFNIPSECPVCKSKTFIKESESSAKTLHCSNEQCPAKKLKKFSKFASKDYMDIYGLSIKTISRLVSKGLITDLVDIYDLDKHQSEIVTMDGFGERSYIKLKKSIEKSKNTIYSKLLSSLSIPLVGKDASKKIFKEMDISEFISRIEERKGFEDIKGIGKKVSDSIITWYGKNENKLEFNNLLKVLTLKNEKTNNSGGKCKELTFVITGDVSIFGNRKELKNYIESQGGKVTGSVTSKTNYLINNDSKSETSKNKKANELGIEIITENEFVKKFGK